MHSPQQPPQRPWWQRSSSSSKLNGESSGTRGTKKLSSIATAIGIKAKRSGTLRPPNSPPSPVLPLHTGLMEPPSPARARAPLPSTSSRPTTTHSSWDEPRTPSDAAKHASLTQSVLTTSEMDPFAAQYIPSSASMLESHRLSVFDDGDEHDDRPGHKSDFTLSYNRESYTSSSEADHGNLLTAPLRPRAFHPHMPDVPDDVGTSPPLLSPGFPSDDDWRHSRATTSSDKVYRHEHFLPLEAMVSDVPGPQIRPSASTSTLRKGRPRGHTDVSRVGPMPTSPTVVIRQPSLPRMIPAPQAPPRSTLPPTPLVPSQHLREPSPGESSSSSGISFASSSGLHPPPAQLAKALKKAVSSHSLKRGSGSSNVPTSPPYESDHSDHTGKAVKKQRSFHHTRIPLPPLPSALRHTASAGSDVMPTLSRHPSASSNAPSVLSQSMGSPPLGAARRRLFSGSSRRSNNSVQKDRDDTDIRSLFSLNGAPPDEVRRPGRDSEISIATQTTGTGSFWDDGEPPSSPGGARERERDYAPQHIMAPADMLRLEEALGADATGSRAAAFMRERGRSFNSVRTSHSGTFSDAAASAESDVHFPGSPQGTLGSPYGSPYVGTSSPRPGVGSPTFGTPPHTFGSPHTGYSSPAGLSPHSPLAPSPALSPRSSTRNSRDAGPPLVRRADSLLQRTLGVPTTRPRRPSTASEALESPIALSRGPSNASSMMSARSNNGLPPPPRRARVPSSGAASAPASRRTSTVPIQPLSPPPKWRTPPSGTRSRAPSDASSRPPPVAGAHRAIARRPSFLEIGAAEEEYDVAEGEDEQEDVVERHSPEDEDYGVELASGRRRPGLSIATPPASVRSVRVPHSAGAGPPPQSAFIGGPSLAREPPIVAVARQPRGSIDDSFLDMGKSSFETVRSDDELDFGR